MNVRSSLWILLFISVQEVSIQEVVYDDYEDPQPLNCSTTESIKGGHVTYSQGGLEGSVLTYHCGPGKYPFPVRYRTCGADGDWSPMRLASGRQASRATCKDVLCPAQLQLDNGDFWPTTQWFGVGMTQSFSCQHGFTLHGSSVRNCTPSGDWTGTTPVCDNRAGDCSDPGTPPGAHRSGRLHTGEKVTYRCQAGLDLLGSSERVCLENREWSGSMPRCQGPNMFDSPSAVAKAMAGSLAGLMDVFSLDSIKKKSESGFGRTVRVEKDSRMNIYILLDTSGSIKDDDFKQSVQATVALIQKLDSYEVKLKFHVLSFASKVIDIVNITDEIMSTNADNVIGNLLDFDHKNHGRQTGTNLHAALHRVYEMINLFKQHSKKNFFSQTQNIIIIETDGYSNTGNKPQAALTKIRHLLGYSNTSSHDHTHEALLDVYVFGVGEQVNKAELNSLASNKRGEAHLFVLKDFPTLGQVFNSMISDKSVTMCGIAQEATSDEDSAFTQPWHVTLNKATSQGPLCSGSIVNQHWVLTAAHCFGRAATDKISYQVDIKTGDATVPADKVIMHPKYNIDALNHRHVPEFYDYDVALVWINKSIPLSWQARPICLPCTIPASRAMKKVNSTCQEHRKVLIPQMETSVFFMNKKTQRKHTHIHTESQRPACVEKARPTLNESDVTLDEYVPDRFLCSGGTKGYQDAVTCKGDSGGSLFLQNRNRYFQVGVVSWGTTDVCKALSSQGYSSDRPPPDARDFHIDVFKILPWLEQHLGNEIKFLPDIN